MTYQREREDFIVAMGREGMPPDVARLIMRHANTVQRLAAAECNGDWPCDNGERKVTTCDRCGAGYVPSVMRKIRMGGVVVGAACPSCTTGDRIKALCVAASGKRRKRFVPECQGDPRGCCVKLHVPSKRDEGYGGVGVPTRRY